ARTAVSTLAETLARLLAPILSHKSEEVWQYLKLREKTPSPQLAECPVENREVYAEVLARWAPVMEVREQVNLLMESARQEGTVSDPLEARVELAAEPGIYAALMAVESDRAPIFKVSQVEVEEVSEPNLRIKVLPAS